MASDCAMTKCLSTIIPEIKTSYKYLFGPVRAITLRNYETNKTIYLFGDRHTEYNEVKFPEDTKINDVLHLPSLYSILLTNNSSVYDCYFEFSSIHVVKNTKTNSSLFNSVMKFYREYEQYFINSHVRWHNIDLRNHKSDIYHEVKSNTDDVIRNAQTKDLNKLDLYRKFQDTVSAYESVSDLIDVEDYNEYINVYEDVNQEMEDTLVQIMSIIMSSDNVCEDKFIDKFQQMLEIEECNSMIVHKLRKFIEVFFEKYTIMEIDPIIKEYLRLWFLVDNFKQFTYKLSLLIQSFDEIQETMKKTSIDITSQINNSCCLQEIKDDFNYFQQVLKNLINSRNPILIIKEANTLEMFMTDYFVIFMDIYCMSMIEMMFNTPHDDKTSDIALVVAGDAHIENYLNSLFEYGYEVVHYSTDAKTGINKCVEIDPNMISYLGFGEKS